MIVINVQNGLGVVATDVADCVLRPDSTVNLTVRVDSVPQWLRSTIVRS